MLPPRLSKVDIHLLYVFVAVAEARSFSAAQAVLNTSPSTISRQVSDLEKRLGATLCQRGRGGFQLTDYGHRVLEAAEKLFHSLEQFRESVAGRKKALTGVLSIGVIDNWISNAKAPIVNALSMFHKQAPEVEIDIHSMAPNGIEYGLLEGSIDVGIGVFHQPKKGLVYQHVSREYMDLFCGSTHPLYSAQDDDLTTVLLEEANLVRRAYLNEKNVAPITSNLKSSSQAHQMEGVAMLILTGHFVGYLPESYALPWVQDGKMKSVAARRYSLPSEIKLVTRRGKFQSEVSELFIRILEQESKAAAPA